MTVEMPPGPDCDVCGEETARMSILDYGDYSQLKIGVGCAPKVLRGIADAMDGRTTAEPEPAPVAPADPTGRPTGSSGGASPMQEPDDSDEPGSAADHWASTTHVRRSTHGHRTPRGATGKPEREPEQ